MKQPAKWRETVDLMSLCLAPFRVKEILGYPHAGNDVFYVSGWDGERPCRAFVKVERQKGADVMNEAAMLRRLSLPYLPRVLAVGEQTPRFLVTEEMPGDRLSVIVGDNADGQSGRYMAAYGAMLAGIHGLSVPCEPVRERRFFHFPEPTDPALAALRAWAERRRPAEDPQCFVHGDCHYANVLWQNGRVSAVLDWELSGWGSQAFDMAWAVVTRPGQRFLTTMGELERFLRGYEQVRPYPRLTFACAYIKIACWFYKLGDDNDKAALLRMMTEVAAWADKTCI